jgi:hypothetical protein
MMDVSEGFKAREALDCLSRATEERDRVFWLAMYWAWIHADYRRERGVELMDKWKASTMSYEGVDQ